MNMSSRRRYLVPLRTQQVPVYRRTSFLSTGYSCCSMYQVASFSLSLLHPLYWYSSSTYCCTTYLVVFNSRIICHAKEGAPNIRHAKMDSQWCCIFVYTTACEERSSSAAAAVVPPSPLSALYHPSLMLLSTSTPPRRALDPPRLSPASKSARI